MFSKAKQYIPLVVVDTGAGFVDTSVYGPEQLSQAPGRGGRYRVCTWTSLALILFVGLLGHEYRSSRCSSQSRSDVPTAPSLGLPQKLQQAWAAYSPYFPAEEYKAPPNQCDIVQIQRHGARYPTDNASADIKKTLKKLKKATAYKDKSVKFLHKYKWGLGENDLVPFGAAQSFDAGQLHYTRYKHLIDEDNLPFLRASGADRVVMSALNWTAGFTAASNHVYSPLLSVILSETSNDTLDNAMCPACERSAVESDEWRSTFTPSILHRLKKAVPGAKLKAGDITNLMSACAFDTVAHEKASPFCSMFTLEEFRSYEYDEDIKKYYYTGYGNAFGRVQGVGYVNELLARLTGMPVEDHTQTNSTLDSSPDTFPLNRTFYADFSHDNTMIAIYGALGLFPQSEAPSVSKPDPHRTWIMSRLVPFSSRMITEKLQCRFVGETKEFVRILVNDAVQPLEFCGAGADGLCELDAFVASQTYARSGGAGDWEKCND
ncbi:acid phosphatase [Leucogyrophana mollusca]|uniref:Acid phosphatase n=1 Tax=Leucogyrophana mollusca TaxID=85980 RepID=A0ACB8BDP4_9AGAM|nr:acid phosphatase [Leucogyrophana mollusca]